MMYSPSNSGGKRQMEETVSGNKKKERIEKKFQKLVCTENNFHGLFAARSKKTYCLGSF